MALNQLDRVMDALTPIEHSPRMVYARALWTQGLTASPYYQAVRDEVLVSDMSQDQLNDVRSASSYHATLSGPEDLQSARDEFKSKIVSTTVVAALTVADFLILGRDAVLHTRAIKAEPSAAQRAALVPAAEQTCQNQIAQLVQAKAVQQIPAQLEKGVQLTLPGNTLVKAFEACVPAEVERAQDAERLAHKYYAGIDGAGFACVLVGSLTFGYLFRKAARNYSNAKQELEIASGNLALIKQESARREGPAAP